MTDHKRVPLGSVPRAGGSCKPPPTFKVHVLQVIVLQVLGQRAATPAVLCAGFLCAGVAMFGMWWVVDGEWAKTKVSWPHK